MTRPSVPAPMRTTDELRKEHGLLDQRVRELDRRAFLTSDEQVERADLKKRKLALKDEIDRLSSLPPSPPDADAEPSGT